MGFDIIEKEADRLSNMVEELLDFSKFVSGKIKLKYEEINLKEFIEYLRLYRILEQKENIKNLY